MSEKKHKLLFISLPTSARCKFSHEIIIGRKNTLLLITKITLIEMIPTINVVAH